MYDELDRVQRTFYEDENYKMTAEYAGGFLFGHIDVYNAGPSVMKHIKNKWYAALDQARAEGYDYLYAYTQNKKFVQFLGNMEYFETVNYENEIYEVYRCPLLL